MIVDIRLFVEALNKRCKTDFILESTETDGYSYLSLTLSSRHYCIPIIEDLYNNGVVSYYSSEFVAYNERNYIFEMTVNPQTRDNFVKLYNKLLNPMKPLKKPLKKFDF